MANNVNTSPGVTDNDLQGAGGGVLLYKRLMGMCCWMGSHFHVCIDYNGVAFSINSLKWGRTFSEFCSKTVLHIYG